MAYFFCPSNWEELEERMVQILSDPGLRDRLGLAGREQVLRSFEIGRCVVPLKKHFDLSLEGLKVVTRPRTK